jgi:hypothetical protein
MNESEDYRRQLMGKAMTLQHGNSSIEMKLKARFHPILAKGGRN